MSLVFGNRRCPGHLKNKDVKKQTNVVNLTRLRQSTERLNPDFDLLIHIQVS